jgi:hypothetical protein
MSNKNPVPFGQTHQSYSVRQVSGKANGNYFPNSPVSVNSKLNPAAGHFQPSVKVSNGNHQNVHLNQPSNGVVNHSSNGQVSSSSLTSMMEKIQVLERSHNGLRTDFEDLKALANSLYSEFGVLKKGRRSDEVGPFQDNTEDFRQKLDQLKLETLKASSGTNANLRIKSGGYSDANQLTQELTPTPSTVSVPPHMRKDSMFIPPHKRGKQQTEQNTGLNQLNDEATQKVEQSNQSAPPQRIIAVARGQVLTPRGFSTQLTCSVLSDLQSNPTILASPPRVRPTDSVLMAWLIHRRLSILSVRSLLTSPSSAGVHPVQELTPPALSPMDSFQPDVPRLSIEDPYHTISSAGWQPLFIRELPPLHPTAAAMIPSVAEMVTFSADFLRNTFGGTVWSSGLNYIVPLKGPAGETPCILPNRTYYTLDYQFEPYLPKQPGDHGAKLTPFFNQNPEEAHPLQDQDGNSFKDVPMFVMTPDSASRNRYVYFGNYSQTRWSDKLDYDRMVEHVPHNVKEYWADELSAVGRPEWLTEQLKKHFFPKPEYDGPMFGGSAEGSVAADEMAELEKEVEQGVKYYVQELKTWEKESTAKVKFIKKDLILQAFEEVNFDLRDYNKAMMLTLNAIGRYRRSPGSQALVGVPPVCALEPHTLRHACPAAGP